MMMMMMGRKGRSAGETTATARSWFVRLLDPDIAVEEIAQWQSWMAQSQVNRDAFERISEVWRIAGDSMPDPCTAEQLAADPYDASQSIEQWRDTRRRGRAWMLGTGLAACLIIGVALFAYDALIKRPVQTISTLRAEHRSTELRDGSHVEIGAMTAVKVRMGSSRRTVHLERGEAYFAVAHDKERPFVVETPLGTMTAIGTAFNVDIGEERVSLTVTEGAVMVRPGNGPTLLSQSVRVNAGQRLDLDDSGPMLTVSFKSAPPRIAWPERQFEYRDEPLRAVVEDVNRYAKHRVVIADPAIGAMNYTGTVRIDAVEEWVNALPATFHVSIVEHDGESVLTRGEPRGP